MSHEQFPSPGQQADAAAISAEAVHEAATTMHAEGQPFSAEQQGELLGAVSPEVSRAHELVTMAGEFAAEGDALSALVVLGDEAGARRLIGNEETDKLLAAARRQEHDGMQ